MSLSALVSEVLERADDIKAGAEALVLEVTGTAAELRAPSVTCQGRAAFVAAYEAAMNIRVDDSFAAPAFAVANRVHFNTDSADWNVGGALNKPKVVSTLIHEYFHASSHGGTGLQGAETEYFKGPGSFMYADEALTDLWGYCLYDKLGLTTYGTYTSGYVSAKQSSLSVGKANGVWLSLAFFHPSFEGLRKVVAGAYFHGSSLEAVKEKVQIGDCVKAAEFMNDVAVRNRGRAMPGEPNYGLPFSVANKSKVGAAFLGETCLPFVDIQGSVIPAGKGTALRALVAAS